MSFLINSYKYTSPSYTGLDIADYIANDPVVVYSTRHINSLYSGPLVKLRRDSDNATSDFSATLGNFVDWAAVDTWAGGANIFVETWYDQSGYDYHAIQTTLSKQPAISTSSTITGTRTVLFNGTSNVLRADTTAMFNGFCVNQQSLYLCHDMISTGFNSVLNANSVTGGGSVAFFRLNRYTGNARHTWQSTTLNPAGVPVSQKEHLYCYYDGANQGINLNDGAFSASSAKVGNSATRYLHIGAGGDATQYSNVHIAELIWFNVSQGASGVDIDTIRDDQNLIYTLY